MMRCSTQLGKIGTEEMSLYERNQNWSGMVGGDGRREIGKIENRNEVDD